MPSVCLISSTIKSGRGQLHVFWYDVMLACLSGTIPGVFVFVAHDVLLQEVVVRLGETDYLKLALDLFCSCKMLNGRNSVVRLVT